MDVTVVASQGMSTLVEYVDEEDRIQRVSVPSVSVDRGQGNRADVHSDTLLMGVPFGLPWEDLIPSDVVIDPYKLANEMRRYGIWTAEDLNNQQAFRTALLRVLSDIYVVIQSTKQDRSFEG